MIKYLYREGSNACEKEPLKVRIDERISGEIRKVVGGYQYFPKGSAKFAGEIFPSVSLVQKTLT